MDRTLIATIFTGLLAAGALVGVVVLAALTVAIPGVLENVLMLSAGAVCTAAGIATVSRTPTN